MTKIWKLRCITIVFGIIALLCGWIAYNGGTYTKILTRNDVQQKVDEAIALYEMNTERSVHVQDVQVSFADNQMHIDANISGETFQKYIQANVHATGTIYYKAGEFYFHPTGGITFDQLKVGKKENSPILFGLTKKLLAEKMQQEIIQHGLEDVSDAFKSDFQEWISQHAQNYISIVLTKYPVYTLKTDLKGIAVRTVLKNVAIVDDTLQVTVSVVQFGYVILISLFSLVIGLGLLIGMITNPELLVSMIFLESI